jgi:hypothetical protein
MTFKTPLLVAAFALLAPNVHAATTVTQDLSNPVDIPGIAGFQTTGADMVGMLVTASLLNPLGAAVSQTLAWGATGPAAGGVSDDVWSLSLDGDSFDSAWSFTLANGWTLLELTLEGQPGLTMFDRSFDGLTGTDGSAAGRDFSSFSLDDDDDNGVDVTATYANPVGVAGSPPVGDLFGILRLAFDEGLVTQGFTFVADTDNDERIINVSEPASLALMGAGLIGLGLLRNRRVRKA